MSEKLQDMLFISTICIALTFWSYLLARSAFWIADNWNLIVSLPASYYIALAVSLAVILAGIWMIARIERGYKKNQQDRD